MLFVSAVHVELPNVVDSDLSLLQLDLVCIGCELVREVANIVWESRRKQDNLYLVLGKHAARQTQQISRDAGFKAMITHFFTRNV